VCSFFLIFYPSSLISITSLPDFILCVLKSHLQDLSVHNADEYIDLTQNFYLRSGIRKQVEAFKGN